MIDIAAIREDFPILADNVYGKPLVYLDNAATTQKPRAVLDRILDFYRHTNSNVHRGVHHLSEKASDAYETARETVRGFLNARSAREIIFTQGTTDAINMVADSFAQQWVKPGDEIIITEIEHHSNLVPWQKICQRQGASLKIVSFDDDGSLQTAALKPLLTDRTRLFAVSYVSNVLGVVNPVREMIRTCHACGVPVLVDAAQAVQHMPVDVQSLDCDFLTFSGHKLYAETGVGVLYGRQQWMERLAPCRFGGGMIQSVDLRGATFSEPPYCFEAGTPNIAGAVSLDAAVRYVSAVGMDGIREHEQFVMACAMRQLAEIDGVRIYGTAAEKCGAVSFNIEGISAYDVAVMLDKLGIAVRSGTHCAEPVMQHYGVAGTVRASFGLYNTAEEIDRLVEGVRRVRNVLV